MIPEQSVAQMNQMCSFPVQQSVKQDSNNFYQYMTGLQRVVSNYNQQLLHINQKYCDVKFESSLKLSSITQLVLMPFDNFSNRLTLATTRYRQLVQDVSAYFQSFQKMQVNPAFQQDYERDFQAQHQRLHVDLQTQFLSSMRALAQTMARYSDFVGQSIKFLREPPTSLIGAEVTETSAMSSSFTNTPSAQTSQPSQSIQHSTPTAYVPVLPKAVVPAPQLSYIPTTRPVDPYVSDAPVI